ncbi:MAG: hypothetical protein DWQ31_10250 [Planctomycetota bacterium]|nr:MAG: hypothetical protein DWQ31_10250 [Planctomycetota bacterium]REK43210.1 MAG: hypothetical protein DWQ46_12625 [Planctomycetota bacterium]
MARQESDREDLLNEATALRERIELTHSGEDEPVTVGFRAGGDISFYFGPEVVYQFNAAGQLRRAHLGDRLIKAERGRLVALKRVRTPEATTLQRFDVDETQTAEIFAAMRSRLEALLKILERGDFHIVGQVPAEQPLIERIVRELPALLEAEVAPSPRVG